MRLLPRLLLLIILYSRRATNRDRPRDTLNNILMNNKIWMIRRMNKMSARNKSVH